MEPSLKQHDDSDKPWSLQANIKYKNNVGKIFSPSTYLDIKLAKFI